jgi:phosphoribosyl 1,2-cyclic phosphodiesterase
MSLFVTALNSGSNGNCYYIGNREEAVLIDAGISCREIERRMARLNLSIKKVKAVFISHEHSDHIKGVAVLSKKYQLPVYITPRTLENAPLDPHSPWNTRLVSHAPVKIGDLEVIAFPKLHDANDPQSFVVSYKNLCVGVFTDIGAPCEYVIKHFKCCNAIFLETNYDDQMLTEGNYPVYLKRRIRSDEGHLSNDQALQLFINHRSSAISHIFLSHISKENNDPERIRSLFSSHAADVKIVLTSRLQEIPVYEIGNSTLKPIQMEFAF